MLIINGPTMFFLSKQPPRNFFFFIYKENERLIRFDILSCFFRFVALEYKEPILYSSFCMYQIDVNNIFKGGDDLIHYRVMIF